MHERSSLGEMLAGIALLLASHIVAAIALAVIFYGAQMARLVSGG